MYVYNITTKIEKQVSADWITWQRQMSIPEIMETKLFTEYKFFELINGGDEDGNTYVIQYYFGDLSDYEKYIHQYSKYHSQKTFSKWGDQFVSFSTIMRTVQ